MASITLFFMKPLFFISNVCMRWRAMVVVNHHTNQSILCPLRPFVSRTNQRFNAP
jgi:hypothetical protein